MIGYPISGDVPLRENSNLAGSRSSLYATELPERQGPPGNLTANTVFDSLWKPTSIGLRVLSIAAGIAMLCTAPLGGRLSISIGMSLITAGLNGEDGSQLTLAESVDEEELPPAPVAPEPVALLGVVNPQAHLTALFGLRHRKQGRDMLLFTEYFNGFCRENANNNLAKKVMELLEKDASFREKIAHHFNNDELANYLVETNQLDADMFNLFMDLRAGFAAWTFQNTRLQAFRGLQHNGENLLEGFLRFCDAPYTLQSGKRVEKQYDDNMDEVVQLLDRDVSFREKIAPYFSDDKLTDHALGDDLGQHGYLFSTLRAAYDTWSTRIKNGEELSEPLSKKLEFESGLSEDAIRIILEVGDDLIDAHIRKLGPVELTTIRTSIGLTVSEELTKDHVLRTTVGLGIIKQLCKDAGITEDAFHFWNRKYRGVAIPDKFADEYSEEGEDNLLIA